MAIALSLLVLAVIALVVGAYVLFRRGVRQKAWLMLGLALVIALNVAIWTVPMQNGDTLVTATAPQ